MEKLLYFQGSRFSWVSFAFPEWSHEACFSWVGWSPCYRDCLHCPDPGRGEVELGNSDMEQPRGLFHYLLFRA